jgi:hypothetical protein
MENAAQADLPHNQAGLSTSCGKQNKPNGGRKIIFVNLIRIYNP